MKAMAWLMVLAAAFLTWRFFYPSYEWHQKITVEIETPEGPVSASSVSEMQAVFQPKILPEIPPVKLRLRGEAVVLEIPGRGTLFALLTDSSSPEYMKYIATTVFRDRLPKRPSHAIFSALSGLDETRDIPPEHYPLLVTFTDISDPTTVHRVDPNNLAATFGAGVTLKRIALTITDEPVTEGEVRKVLRWLDWPKIDPTLNDGRSETFRYPNNSPRGYGTFSTNDLLRP